MRTIWYSLAWKEWHEHKWKLAAVAAVLCGVNALCLWNLARDVFSSGYMMTAFCIVPLAVFIGAGVAAGESSRKTMPFLQALPAPLWRVALHKLLAGLATLFAATIVAFIFVFFLYWCLRHSNSGAESALANAWKSFPPSVRFGNWFTSSAATICIVGGSILLWTAISGVNAADEIGAGARAIVVMVAWWGLLIVLASHSSQEWFDTHKKLVTSLVSVSPGGAVSMFPRMLTMTAWAESTWPVVFGLAFNVLLAVGFLIRFGRRSGGRISWKPRNAGTRSGLWLSRPWRSTWLAIAWKQFRESGPLVATGVAGVVGFTALFAAGQWLDLKNRPDELVGFYLVMSAGFGFFTTVVVGIGVSLADLTPKLNNFWRSRPIDPNQWFWAKFFSGIFVLFLSIFVPAVIVIWLNGNSIDISPRNIFAFVAVDVAVYIAAVTITCLVRHAVYAAILSIAAIYAGFFMAWVFAFAIYRMTGYGPPIRTMNDFPMNVLTITALATLAGGTLLMGWLATRNDWGRKN